MQTEPDTIIAETRRWLERAVIGLNLCPFAKSVHIKNQIRWRVSEATTPEALLADLVSELAWLRDADPELTDTTLLMHPGVLQDFLAFNDFLDVADEVVAEHDLEGVIQIAPFHPDFQFEGTAPDDVTNCTNRSPFPTLHLLREDSVARAIASPGGDADAIVERNQQTLRDLGHDGWQRLLRS
mgnify:CR=1 FL=1